MLKLVALSGGYSRQEANDRLARNLGMVAGVELESRPGAPGARAYEAFLKCLELGVLVRYTGDILAFSPPLIISEAEIDQLFDTVKQALQSVK